jgi:hypothetical protein
MFKKKKGSCILIDTPKSQFCQHTCMDTHTHTCAQKNPKNVDHGMHTRNLFSNFAFFSLMFDYFIISLYCFYFKGE